MKIIFSLLIVILFLSQSFCNTIQELDINGDFEIDRDNDNLPDGWKSWQRDKLSDNVTFLYDSLTVFSGKRALKIINYGDKDANYYLEEKLIVSPEDHNIYKLNLYIKTENVEGLVWCGIYTINKEGKPWWRYATIRTGGTHEWKKFSVEFGLPPDAEKMGIHLVLEGKGTVWFDHLKFFRRKAKGCEQMVVNGEVFLKVDQEKLPFFHRVPIVLLPSDPDSLWQGRAYKKDESIKQELFAAQGETKAFTLFYYSPESLSGLHLEASDLISSSGQKIPAKQVIIQKIHYWDQRRSWSKHDYYTIPELILSCENQDFTTIYNKSRHYWISIEIPEHTAKGDYSGQLKISVDNNEDWTIDVKLNILPFILRKPVQQWGLYCDSPRWEKYSDSEIENEMKKIKAQGFNLQLINAPGSNYYSLENGTVQIDLDEINRYLQIYKKVGFEGPVVLSAQWMDSHIQKLLKVYYGSLNDEIVNATFLSIVQEIARMQKKQNWPELLFHIIDEPLSKSEKRRKRARYLLTLIRQVGFQTFITSDEKIATQEFGEIVDVPCFGVGFVARTQNQNERLGNEIRKQKKPFWWYGSGCYMGQEGKIFPNRFLAGYLLWKSGADAQWSWTFQRPNEDPFNDFDGTGKELKDACITYPLKKGNGFIPTLQWEGIREGITDMEYIATLEYYIQQGKQSRNSATIEEAKEAGIWLENKKNVIPWLFDGGLDNVKADTIRWEIAQRIVELKKLF